MPIGEEHGQARLTERQVRTIRKCDLPYHEIAAQFGLSVSHVGKIKRRQAWKHVKEPDK